MAFFFRKSRRAAVFSAVVLFAGCTGVDFRGPGFDDEFYQIGRKLRPQPVKRTEGDFMGISTKARQIEENLGI